MFAEAFNNSHNIDVILVGVYNVNNLNTLNTSMLQRSLP